VAGKGILRGLRRRPALSAMLAVLVVALGCALFLPAVEDTAVPTGAEPAQKVVYLTFDDGPSAVTEGILDYLQEQQVQATFFVIGMETERAETLLKRMVAEGHSIGLHSYSHQYSAIYAYPEAFFADQQKLCDYLQPIIGYTPTIFRFPGGSCNATASDWTLSEIRRQAEEKGMVWFDWNALAEDSGATTAPADQMAQNIIGTGGERDRILVLMHDNSVRTTAVDCLRIIIPYYKEKGYTFAALTADTEPIQFGN
jgi:peptidoglycan/xylan/chitin deacetylase (PgdA/CDA1 family)